MQASARHRLINLAHSALLLGGMALAVWLTGRAAFDPLTALITVGAFLAGGLFSPGVSKEMLLALYGAKRLDLGEYPFFRAAMTELSERAGLSAPPDLYYLPSAAPNAFAIGSRQSSAVCVSDGLLRLLDRREFTGVLGHEISHIAHGDLWIMGLADAMTRLTTLLSYIGQFLLLMLLPLMILGVETVSWWAPLALIFLPAVASLLQLALSRTREFDADRGAAELTGDAAGLASALAKLERRMGGFWEEILLPGRRIPEPSLLRTHPPTAERIARLRELASPTPRPAGPLETPSSVPRVARAPQLFWTGIWR